MKIYEIEASVVAFRENEMQKVNNRLNAIAPRQQSAELIAAEMQAVDVRVDTYRASLGVPDDQPEPQADELPVPAAKPGVKA